MKEDKIIRDDVNPYVNQVKEHKNILIKEEDIYALKWKWKEKIWNNKDLRLEIWTWLWNFFSLEASREREYSFIWMEIKYKRLFKTAEKTLKKWVEDFMLIKDYAQNIKAIFADEEISQTYIFFPDPWPKKRHSKNRLMQVSFFEKLFDITKVWWKIIFKTDSLPYFKETLSNAKKSGLWTISTISYDYENELENVHKTTDLTEFETIFRNQNIKINYVEFIKNSNKKCLFSKLQNKLKNLFK